MNMNKSKPGKIARFMLSALQKQYQTPSTVATPNVAASVKLNPGHQTQQQPCQ